MPKSRPVTLHPAAASQGRLGERCIPWNEAMKAWHPSITPLNMNHVLRIAIFSMVMLSIAYGQVIQKTGYIYTEISGRISSMPSDTGNHYFEPNVGQLATWGNTLDLVLDGFYAEAADSAQAIGYELIQFTDTFSTPFTTYYILATADTHYWGTYVYNPNYCRPLVIQAPHSKRDANTGHQGIHIFRRTQAMFYQVNGTHRCNSTVFSSCSGTTTACGSSSMPYPVSDLAHTTKSFFQKATEVLFQSLGNTHFIQLHGFTKRSTDPYVILSNGTQDAPSPDYMSIFKDNLFQEDTVLTFKIAHIDLGWTRLRGFWNTQGRFINSSPDPCGSNASRSFGRFFHVEQERVRLRSDAAAWNKTANALNNTFPCTPVSLDAGTMSQQAKAYPNPTRGTLTLSWNPNQEIDQDHFIFNLQGQNLSGNVSLSEKGPGQARVDLVNIPTGCYIIRFGGVYRKIYKH